jgi:hypothetical protein
MALQEAIQLNRDAIFLIQTGFEERAILLYSGWENRLTADLVNSDATGNQLEVHLIPDCPSSSRSPSPIPSANDHDTVYIFETSVASNRTMSSEAKSQLIASTAVFVIRSIQTADQQMSAVPVQDCGADPASSYVFTLYSRAFDFDTDFRAMTRLGWLRCAANIPVVFLFNMGVAHHIRAVHNRSMQQFTTALSCYLQVRHILEDHAANGVYDHGLDILVMALYNNMGHCYERQNDSVNAMFCFDQLLVFFLFSDLTPLLTDEEYRFFSTRATLGRAAKTKLAPAP